MTQHRVFFALWPNDTVRDEINQVVQPLVKGSQARYVPRYNWHITLAFVGNVNDTTLSCLIKHAGKIQLQPFSLTLNHFDYWPNPRVVWLGCQSVPKELTDLVGQLNTELVSCDYHADDKIFTPHISLLRNAKRALNQPPDISVTWQVNHFVLVESEINQQGSSYRVIKRWSAA